MRGSMAVEASYVFSLCFLIIGAVCILGIYAYNCSVLKMTGYECILKTREERELGQSAMYENLLLRAKEHGNERTFGVLNLDTSLKMSSTTISLTYEGVQSILHLPLKITSTFECTDPEKTLRIAREFKGADNEGTVKERVQ